LAKEIKSDIKWIIFFLKNSQKLKKKFLKTT
jgi:hypothetical protein